MEDTMADIPEKRRSLLFWGLVLLLCGFAVNTTFLLVGIHGYLREFTRLTTIVGLVLTLIGLVMFLLRLIQKNMHKS